MDMIQNTVVPTDREDQDATTAQNQVHAEDDPNPAIAKGAYDSEFSTARSFVFDIPTLMGSALGLIILVGWIWVVVSQFNQTSENSTSLLEKIWLLLGAAIACSPLVISKKIESTISRKIFSGYGDFLGAILWFPLAIICHYLFESDIITVAVLFVGYFVDSVWVKPDRLQMNNSTRISMAYARSMSGLLGTILIITIVFKLFSAIKSDHASASRSIKSVLLAGLWAYVGKKYFEFIGVIPKKIDVN